MLQERTAGKDRDSHRKLSSEREVLKIYVYKKTEILGDFEK